MSTLGTRTQCEAQHVRPGDFTTFSGFRQAVNVRPATQRRTRFDRCDGSSETRNRTDYITIYRPPAIDLAPTAPFDPTQTQRTQP